MSSREDVTIAGGLACAVAALPDEFALDFLRGYHDIMCDCGNGNHPTQQEWWNGVLTQMRAHCGSQNRSAGAVPRRVRTVLLDPAEQAHS